MTRAECVGHVGPCGFISCKWHLAVDVSVVNGNIKLNFPDDDDDGVDISSMADTCALDVADRGGVSLEAAGTLTNLTRERIRQIEDVVLVKLGLSAPWMRDHLDDIPSGPGAYRSPRGGVARLSTQTSVASQLYAQGMAR